MSSKDVVDTRWYYYVSVSFISKNTKIARREKHILQTNDI